MGKSYLFRLHFVIFLWGFTAILVKLIQTDAYQLVFYRMGLAAIFLYSYSRFILKNSLKISRSLLLKLMGIGTMMGFHWLLFFYSIKVSNVSITLACLSFCSIFVAMIEPLVFKRKIELLEVFIGLIIVVCLLFIFKAEVQYIRGIIAGIICALFSAIFIVLNGKIYAKTSSINVIFYELFGGWLVLTLFSIGSGQMGHFMSITLNDFALIVLLASVFTAFPMLESINLMKYISPFTFALTVNLEPVYGIILAYYIFGNSEQMTPVFYISTTVMLLAIITNGLVKAKRRKQLEK